MWNHNSVLWYLDLKFTRTFKEKGPNFIAEVHLSVMGFMVGGSGGVPSWYSFLETESKQLIEHCGFVLPCVYIHFTQPVALKSLTGSPACAVKAPKSQCPAWHIQRSYFTFAVSSRSPSIILLERKPLSVLIQFSPGGGEYWNVCATTGKRAQRLLGRTYQQSGERVFTVVLMLALGEVPVMLSAC